MTRRTHREIALDKAEEFIREYQTEYEMETGRIKTGRQSRNIPLPFNKATLADLLMEFLDEVS